MKERIFTDWNKCLMAGVLIGLCFDMYRKTGGVTGALLFSIGLLTICMFDLPLFTGRVGSSNDIIRLVAILVYNIAGVGAIKTMLMINDLIVLGIFCGVLMQIAVSADKKNLPVLTIMCVAGFILSGYKHCIACVFPGIELLDMCKVVVGNVIGAKIAYYCGIKS